MRCPLTTAALALGGLAAGLLLGCTGAQHSGGVYFRDLNVYQGGAPGQAASILPASSTAPIILDPHDERPVFLAVPSPFRAGANATAGPASPLTLSFDTSNAGGNARGADAVSPSTTATATGSLPGSGG